MPSTISLKRRPRWAEIRNEATKGVSPLRLRMIEDMRLRKLERRTQESYIRGVCRLAKYLGRSPQTATAEDLRRFQLHLVEAGMSSITLNATITAVKFLFQVTLDRPYVVSKLRRVRVEQKLPVVLSCEEVALLIESAPNLKVRRRCRSPTGRDCGPARSSR